MRRSVKGSLTGRTSHFGCEGRWFESTPLNWQIRLWICPRELRQGGDVPVARVPIATWLPRVNTALMVQWRGHLAVDQEMGVRSSLGALERSRAHSIEVMLGDTSVDISGSNPDLCANRVHLRRHSLDVLKTMHRGAARGYFAFHAGDAGSSPAVPIGGMSSNGSGRQSCFWHFSLYAFW
jgi:hypothetical protein